MYVRYIGIHICMKTSVFTNIYMLVCFGFAFIFIYIYIYIYIDIYIYIYIYIDR